MPPFPLQKYEQGFITDPVVMSPRHTVEQLQEAARSHGFSGFPVTESGRKGSRLIGLITGRDIDFIGPAEMSRTVEEVLFLLSYPPPLLAISMLFPSPHRVFLLLCNTMWLILTE